MRAAAGWAKPASTCAGPDILNRLRDQPASALPGAPPACIALLHPYGTVAPSLSSSVSLSSFVDILYYLGIRTTRADTGPREEVWDRFAVRHLLSDERAAQPQRAAARRRAARWRGAAQAEALEGNLMILAKC